MSFKDKSKLLLFIIKSSLFAGLAAFALGAHAEYYLVYSAEPATCIYGCKAKTKKHKVHHTSVKKKIHYAKPKHKSGYQIETYYTCERPAWSPYYEVVVGNTGNSCGVWTTSGQVLEYGGKYSRKYVEFSEKPYSGKHSRRHYQDDDYYTSDMATGDDDASRYPDMNIDRY